MAAVPCRARVAGAVDEHLAQSLAGGANFQVGHTHRRPEDNTIYRAVLHHPMKVGGVGSTRPFVKQVLRKIRAPSPMAPDQQLQADILQINHSATTRNFPPLKTGGEPEDGLEA